METICKNGRLKAIFFKSFSRHMRKPSYATKHLVMAPYRRGGAPLSVAAARTNTTAPPVTQSSTPSPGAPRGSKRAVGHCATRSRLRHRASCRALAPYPIHLRLTALCCSTGQIFDINVKLHPTSPHTGEHAPPPQGMPAVATMALSMYPPSIGWVEKPLVTMHAVVHHATSHFVVTIEGPSPERTRTHTHTHHAIAYISLARGVGVCACRCLTHNRESRPPGPTC